MRSYFSYLVYLIRHKWFVFVECVRLGIPWLGIIHDLSKFHPVEFFAAAHQFYGTRKQQENAKKAYDYSWLHHQHWNKHHWQHWILVQDEDKDKILPMLDRYRRELLADWRGGWKAAPLGFIPPLPYYRANKDKMLLHPNTRTWIEKMLGGLVLDGDPAQADELWAGLVEVEVDGEPEEDEAVAVIEGVGDVDDDGEGFVGVVEG